MGEMATSKFACLLPWGFGISVIFFSHPLTDFMKFELPSVGRYFTKDSRLGC